jgi:hypothetical protein
MIGGATNSGSHLKCGKDLIVELRFSLLLRLKEWGYFTPSIRFWVLRTPSPLRFPSQHFAAQKPQISGGWKGIPATRTCRTK